MRIGLVQGRLLPPIDGRIQSFPADGWRQELVLCARAGFDGIEWIHTVDAALGNPIVQPGGAPTIASACHESGSRVLSGCYDALLAARVLEDVPAGPTWQRHFAAIAIMAGNLRQLGASHLVLPLLGENRIESDRDRELAVRFVRGALTATMSSGIEIHLETSLPSAAVLALVEKVADPRCLITFDTGNVVQFGFDWRRELRAQLPVVGSVHLKDSTREMGTVPLGTGDVDFHEVARTLAVQGFRGDCIIQGARVPGRDDFDLSRGYLRFISSAVIRASSPAGSIPS